MTAPGGILAAPPGRWGRGRFFLIVAILFVAQIGIIALVGERPRKSVSGAPAPTVFRALASRMDQNEISRTFFVADPIVFASATPHGFSGRAWLRFQPARYGPADELETPTLLALDTSHLGTKLRVAEETNQVPFQLGEQQGPPLEPLPVISAPTTARGQSAYHIEGALASRQVGPVVPLLSWPTNQLLANSVVEFAVDRAGQVVVDRLVSRCGLADADLEAVAVVHGLRFSPLAATTWSKAVFEWQTVEPKSK